MNINGGAERDRTVGLLNAIHFHSPPLFSILLVTVRSYLKNPLTKITLLYAVVYRFLLLGAQKKHRERDS
jgi:hypothetical protein